MYKFLPIWGGFGVLAAYALTSAPAIYTWDSATFTAAAYTLGIVHAPGYPLYLLLLRGFSALLVGLPFVWAVNLFSGVCGALTAGVMLRLLAVVNPGRGGVNTAAVLLFAFSPAMWGQAVRAEVYTLNTLLVSLLLLAVVQGRGRTHPRWGFGVAVLAGLTAGHHPAGALVVMVVIVVMIAGGVARPLLAKPGRVIAGLMLTLLAAYALPYLYLPIRSASEPAFDLVAAYFPDRDLTHWRDVLWMMRGGMFADRVFGLGLLAWLAELGRFGLAWARQTLGVGVLLTGMGFWGVWRQDRWLGGLLACAFAAQVIFFTGYDVFDKWEMFHTAYLIGSIGLAVGLSQLPHLPRWLLIVVVAAQVGLNLEAGAFNERRYEQVARETLDVLPPGAMLVGPWTSIRPVEAVQIVYGLREDVDTLDTSMLALGLDGDEAAIASATAQHIDGASGRVFVVQPSAGLQSAYELRLAAPGLYEVWKYEQ